MNWCPRPISIACFAAGLLCLCEVSGLQAQGLPDALAPATGFTPVLTLADSITDSLKTTVVAGVTSREVVTKGTTKVNITANITGISLANIDETTEFAITVGDLSIAGDLGDAVGYSKGKTTAFIAFNTDDMGAPKGTNGLRLTWTATRLTIVITRSLGDGNDPGGIIATQFAGQTDPKVRDMVNASVQFAGVSSAARPVLIQGSCSVRSQTTGTAPDTEEYELNTVTLTGAGDFTAPTVTITTPKPNTSPGANAMVSGSAKDTINLARIEYATNPDSNVWTNVPFTLQPPLPPNPGWGPTTATWTFNLTARPHGTTVVWVRAIDGSGNESKPAMISFVNPMPVQLTGRWDALVQPGLLNGVRGVITFTCDTKGVLSGKLTLEGTVAPMPFTGTCFGTTVQAVIKSSGKPDINLTGQVSSLTPGSAAQLTLAGQLQPAGAASPSASFTAFRSHWSNTVPLPLAAIGRYHSFLDASAANPVVGHGYVILTTAKAGTFTGSGKLADGTLITLGGVLGSGGQVPVYIPLYTSKGSLSVLPIIAVGTGLPSASTATWRRPINVADKQFPLGFSLDLTMTMARYTAPATGTRVLGLTDLSSAATATWEGDAIAPAQTQNVTLSTANKATFTPGNPAALKVNITATTGLITGDFKLPGSTTLAKYDAIIVGTVARGFYIAPAPTGSAIKRFGRFQLEP